jgi:hypothetical protein
MANLITLQEYKTYAGLTTPNHDAEVNNLIPKVSELVKNYCKRSFTSYVDEDKVETFNGAVASFILEETPVLQVIDVEYSSDYGRTYTSLIEYTDWVEDNGYIVAVNPNGWPRQLRGYRVTYRAGYETLPEDLKLAVMDLVTYYRRNDGAIHSTKAPGTNNVQIEYISTTSLPAHIRRVLDLHRADYT